MGKVDSEVVLQLLRYRLVVDFCDGDEAVQQKYGFALLGGKQEDELIGQIVEVVYLYYGVSIL